MTRLEMSPNLEMRKSSPSADERIFADSNLEFLLANDIAYRATLDDLRAQQLVKDRETVLRCIARAANQAVRFHSGRFADGTLENLAVDIGVDAGDRATVGLQLVRPTNEVKRRVLHVTTEANVVGGHTRMIQKWIQLDGGSRHSVALTHQTSAPVPIGLREAVHRSGGIVAELPETRRLMEKAWSLREIARANADLVVLHHFGHDVTPTVAFAQVDGPPVVVLNHADHLFWLGSSVADMTISLRTPGLVLAQERRSIDRNFVLPIPVAEPDVTVSRTDARRRLGISENAVVMLSVGRAEKYLPCGSYNFVSTAAEILRRNPEAHLFVIGGTATLAAQYIGQDVLKRIHFVGVIEDASDYRASADLYLESFPFGSNTALLEAALSGLPVVPAYAPLSLLLVANNDSISDLARNPLSEQSYIEEASSLIRFKERRAALGGELRRRVLEQHTGDGWIQKVNEMYAVTDALDHCVRAVPPTRCSTAQDDIALSIWRAMTSARPYLASANREANAARYRAFLSLRIEKFDHARRQAWIAATIEPGEKRSWMLLLVALLGRFGAPAQAGAKKITRAILGPAKRWAGFGKPM